MSSNIPHPLLSLLLFSLLPFPSFPLLPLYSSFLTSATCLLSLLLLPTPYFLYFISSHFPWPNFSCLRLLFIPSLLSSLTLSFSAFHPLLPLSLFPYSPYFPLLTFSTSYPFTSPNSYFPNSHSRISPSITSPTSYPLTSLITPSITFLIFPYFLPLTFPLITSYTPFSFTTF